MGHPANGTLYGATPYGGPQNLGTVFTLNQSLDHFIALVRYAGKTGSAVQILGQALAGTTSVTFNGVAATMFHVSSNTFMTAVVPAGATSGPVVVTTPSQKFKSKRNFQVIP